MAGSDDERSTATVPPDLLPLLQRSGILNERQLDDIRDKARSGEYPSDSSALAARLIAEQVLTEFQARRLLRNKATGFVVGRFVVLDRLGEGSKGRVFKAQHKLMGRLVALKIIAPQIATRASSIARFQREIRLLGRLDHPNVVRALDADQSGDLLYLVMEYVAGRDLERVLQDRGTLSPGEVAAYMAQAAFGLAHAHDRGIVHRDIKPTNLLLSEEGCVKVLDLGLGALMEADSEASFATAAGHSVGTLNYMSPEQAVASDVDGRSDLYSLGCTMYHLLTGQVPFPGDTIPECLKRRASGSPVPITDLRPDLPAVLVAVLNKMMAHRPEDRFQTANEAALALQDVAHQPGAEPRPALRSSPRPGTRSSSAESQGTDADGAEPGTSISPPFATPRPWRAFSWNSPAVLATWPRAGTSLILLLVASLIFVIGFAVGQGSAMLLMRAGK
jgi:serine/threonine-protein kinase